jgi:acyl-CoA synthetase (AMP-forming)/AMP-acid ligase II
MKSALVQQLNRHADLRPDSVAVREVGESGAERTFTWEELRSAAAALAERLRASEQGAVVMIGGSNRAELLAGILGGLCANASVLPVSSRQPARELAALAARASVGTVIGDSGTLEAMRDLAVDRIPLRSVQPRARATGAAADASGSGRGRRSGSILLKSSGTTGLPKLVRRNAAALDAVGESCARAIGVRATDAMLIAIPLHHSYGIDQGVLTAVTAGCRIELHERFDPARVIGALAAGRISVLPGVPWIFDALARTARAPARAPALRRAFSAGSPLPRRVFEQFQRAFGVSIGQIYGATEFGSVTYNDPEDPHFDPESAGRPLHGVRLRVLDAADARMDRPLPPGREGQLAVSSPSMLTEYVGQADPATQSGFLRTGDLARLDERGRLWLTGRLKFLIDIGSVKVNPVEIESVLRRHPAVREAVILAVPHRDTVSRLKAIVVPEPGERPSSHALKRFARDHLIHYMVPRSFEIRTAVPRSATGKILRQELQSEIATEARP